MKKNLEKDQVYKMYLCTPIYKDKACDNPCYYRTNKGYFNGDKLMEDLVPLLVTPVSNNYVKEIVTGLKIPYISVYAALESYPDNYYCEVVGNFKALAYAFSLQKDVNLEKKDDYKYLLEEAYDVDIIHYEKLHCDKEIWAKFLTKVLDESQEEAKDILEARKKLLKEKRKQFLMRILKK